MINPSVIARLAGAVLESLERGTRILVEGEAFRAVLAGRLRAVERRLALVAVEADEMAVRAGAPQHAVLVDVAPAHADAFLRDGVELAEVGLRVKAQEA